MGMGMGMGVGIGWGWGWGCDRMGKRKGMGMLDGDGIRTWVAWEESEDRDLEQDEWG